MKGENIQISGKVDTHLSGTRWAIVALCAVSVAFALSGIGTELKRQNDLREKELQVKMRQTEIMQKQYTLDSLQFSKVR